MEKSDEHITPINVQHTEWYDDNFPGNGHCSGTSEQSRKCRAAPDSSSLIYNAVALKSVPVVSTSCPPTQADNLVGALENDAVRG